jgi:hypothetical protein
MDDELRKQLDALDTRRAQLLFDICENDKIWMPELILGMVQEIRSITKIIRILKGGDRTWH